MMREMPQQRRFCGKDCSRYADARHTSAVFSRSREEIPLIMPWIWPKEDTVNLFNDRVSFYTDKSGAEKMAAEVEQAEKKQDIRLPVQKRAAKAAQLARREYSAESAGKRVRQALAMQPDQYKRPGSIFLPSEKSSINIDIPTAIGHYTAGDYALASDLAEGLTRGGAKVDLTFYNSLYKYPAETNILLRDFCRRLRTTSAPEQTSSILPMPSLAKTGGGSFFPRTRHIWRLLPRVPARQTLWQRRRRNWQNSCGQKAFRRIIFRNLPIRHGFILILKKA